MDSDKISAMTKQITKIAEGYTIDTFSINVTASKISVTFEATKNSNQPVTTL